MENQKRTILLLIIILYTLFVNVKADESSSIGIYATISEYFSQDEILIKFKEHTGSINENKIGLSSIDELNTVNKIISVEKVFKEKQKLAPGKFKRSDGKEIDVPNLDKWYKLKLPKGSDLQSIIKKYREDPSVEYVGPNLEATLFSLPNDSLFQYQWNLNNIGQGYFGIEKNSTGNYTQVIKYGKADADIDLPEALDLLNGSEQEIIIAVIDTGLNYTHEDMVGQLWTNPGEIPNNGIDDDGNGYIDDVHGWDFANNDNDPMDLPFFSSNHGHGTHCAGIIAAKIDNSLGIAGINSKAKIMSVKIFDGAKENKAAEAIKYAADNGARVLSNSWGFLGGYNSKLVQDAINYAYAMNAVIIFSAGNTGSETAIYPAAGENVIAVSATNSSDQHASFTTYGPWIDVAAPGVDILSLRHGDLYKDGTHIVADNYYIMSGTSMATPHVAGLASLILSKNPGFTNDEVLQIIRQSTDDVETHGWDLYSGYGRINAQKALKLESVCIAKITNPHMYDSFHRTEILEIKASAYGSNFSSYILEYGKGKDPSNWFLLTNSSSPVYDVNVASLNLSKLDFGFWSIRLKVKDNRNNVFEDRVVFSVSPPIMFGWPVDVNYLSIDQSPIVGDINNDGHDEVIIGSREILAYNYTGGLMFNSFESEDGMGIHSNTPALGNFYSDIHGKQILAMKVDFNRTNSEYNYSKKLHFLTQDGVEVQNWPKTLYRYYSYGSIYFNDHEVPPIIADINNDGYSEIIQPIAEGLGYQNIHVFNYFGEEIQGWPKRFSLSKVAVGNIDNDSELEIVVATGFTTGELIVLQHNGTYEPGWPIKTFNTSHDFYYNQPILGDIDNDGLDEIIIQIPGHGLYAFNGDGSTAEGIWPVDIEGYSLSYPVTADIDKDGRLEIVIQGGRNDDITYVVNHDGTIADGWPRNTYPVASTPLLGDINDDGNTEIILVSWRPPHVYIFEHDGSTIGEWGIEHEFSFSSPALGDLDNDSGLELILAASDLGGQSKIYVYDFEMKSGATLWPMIGNDERHQNRYVVKCQVDGSGNDGFCYTKCGANQGCDGILRGTGCCVGCHNADIVDDKVIDIFDLVTIAIAYGSQPGDTSWNAKADLNNDNVIDIFDLVVIALGYGKTC